MTQLEIPKGDIVIGMLDVVVASVMFGYWKNNAHAGLFILFLFIAIVSFLVKAV